jgi:hypothetical protein
MDAVNVTGVLTLVELEGEAATPNVGVRAFMMYALEAGIATM